MTETIFTSQTSSQTTDFSQNSRIICRVCEKQFTQYTCPRCNIRYCSLQCYKSHSIRCTESFMRDNVIEELQQIKPDEKSKKKMIDILKRFNEEAETRSIDRDESDSFLSEETIQKILSGAPISYDGLSLDEKKHFNQSIASGELGKFIDPWNPWWLKPSVRYLSLGSDGSRLIKPFGKQESVASSEDASDSDQCHDVPAGPEVPILPVSKLTTSDPSPLLRVHVVDIIYSYCFTLRLYNGDWASDPLESVMILLSVSSILDQRVQPETVFEALLHCMESTCSVTHKHMGGLPFGLTLTDDVSCLLYLGGPALVCLLCDLQKMLQAADKELKFEKTIKLKKPELKRKLRCAARKAYFIMSWIHEQPTETWSMVAAVVNSEKSSVMESAGSKRDTVRMTNKPEGSSLIKEVST